ncbi:hypothetical protein N9L81_02790 [Planktomarina temperata]|nr:hypothetical protein [Planktomarina temperata]
MAEELPKINRRYSFRLDVYTGPDHPEVSAKCDHFYEVAGMSALETKGNRKAKCSVREFKAFIFNLYVKRLKDLMLSIGISKDKGSQKVGNHYSGL